MPYSNEKKIKKKRNTRGLLGRSRAILQLRLLRLSRLLRHRSGEYGKLAMASRDNYEGYISRKESSVVKLWRMLMSFSRVFEFWR